MVGLNDTTPEAERVHLDLLRGAPPGRRLRLALSLSRTLLSLSRDRLARALPDAPAHEVDIRFVAALYGSDLAEEVRAYVVASQP